MTIQSVSLLDLSTDSCRWPIGDGSDTLFCGDIALVGCSYCTTHRALAYTPDRKRQASGIHGGRASPSRS
jgi:hypothetical protein